MIAEGVYKGFDTVSIRINAYTLNQNMKPPII